MSNNIDYVPYMQIAKNISINKGDVLYIVSDVLEIAKNCRDNDEVFDCEEFIVSLQRAVGDTGTLLFSTFNWDFCNGTAFDYHKTRGKTGKLGNVALQMPGFKRTQHPLYSFAVWGHYSELLSNMTNITSFGEDSPFGFMYNNAHMLIFGNPHGRGYTFIHYVEQKYGVDFRYEKEFTADYTDKDENVESRTYSMYVRDLDINPQLKDYQFKELDEWMSSDGIIDRTFINNIPYDKIKLEQMYEYIKDDLLNNKSQRIYIFGSEEPLEDANNTRKLTCLRNSKI